MIIISYVLLYILFGYIVKLFADYEAYNSFKKHDLKTLYEKDLRDNTWFIIFWPLLLGTIAILIIGGTGQTIVESIWNYLNKNKEGK